jgi:hypothetical protein
MVRAVLAQKISGTLMGLWLLVPEYLRLGAWDLLNGWSGPQAPFLQPHIALQVVNEAALGITGERRRRLCHRGFDVANGLPVVASDGAIHQMLDSHTVAGAQDLQRALGRVRRANGHFNGNILAIDPHRLLSYSQRQMVQLKPKPQHPAQKVSQTFFCLDAETAQPVCFTTGSSSRCAADAAIDLLPLASDILQPAPGRTLVLADTEHHVEGLFDFVKHKTPFDLLVPMPRQACYQRQLHALSPESFHSHWVGFATVAQPFSFKSNPSLPLTQWVQRLGEPPGYCSLRAFLCTSPRNELLALSDDYPQRWHIEEFFHDHQDLGWKRAGTLNQNVRYGAMTLTLLAQAALYQLRQRLGDPWQHTTAAQFSQQLLRAIDGDLRVHGDTLIVTFYNAPQSSAWKRHFQDLPALLESEHVRPNIPWLFDFKLDFRFK